MGNPRRLSVRRGLVAGPKHRQPDFFTLTRAVRLLQSFAGQVLSMMRVPLRRVLGTAAAATAMRGKLERGFVAKDYEVMR